MSTFPPWGTQPPPPGYTAYYDPQGNAPQVMPAYNTVQVRQSLQPPHLQTSSNLPNTVQPTSATPSPPSTDKFPASCREWVSRTYLSDNAIPGISREEFESKLKEIIREATAQGRLWSIDWNSMDLPQQMIQKERAAMQPQFNGNGAAGTPSKKRKSLDNEDGGPAKRPWNNANNGAPLEDRLSYPNPQSRLNRFQDDSFTKANNKFQKNLEKRQRKFDGGYKSTYKSPSPEPTAGPVVGRCQILEKKYFRLTSAPDPAKVRPLHILQQALEVLKYKWRKEGNYSYICDQLKSMRQDLTVQRIQNEFTVSVYEIHARIALEKGDLGEYNQCQTQLKGLYARGIAGKDVEFKAYRILYFIHTANRTALNDALAELTQAEKMEPPIEHAIAVWKAMNSGNYHKFFRLYLDTPNMGAYLMDMFVTRERLLALAKICKSYKPNVKLRFITEELGFEGDNEAYTFLMEYSPDHVEEKSDGTEDVFYFLCGGSGASGIYQNAMAEAFKKIDLKGQI